MRRNSTRALNLAHLVGPAIRASEDDDQDDKVKGRRAEDEDDKDNERDDKPGSRRARRAEDEDDKDKDKPQGRTKSRRAKSRAAEDDEQDEKPSGRRASRAEDEDDEGEGDPKGRRTAAEEDEDDEERSEDDDRKDDEDDANPKTRAARRRERERCQAIVGSKHAKGRAAAAAHLAFGTSMTAGAAIGLLKTLPGGESAEGGALGARMQSYGGHRPAASAPPAPSGRQAVTNSWDAAATRAGIRKR
jgi:hypothetical protein